MKNISWLFVIVLFCACDSENAPDCFQKGGDTIRKEFEVSGFSRILVNPNIEMIIKQGNEFSVYVETGENLLEEVSAVVENERLILNNTNDCNLVRSFKQTTFYVTAPDITEIRSATQFDIASEGVLSFPSLGILSEDFGEDTGSTNGTFHLTIDNNRVSVVGNNVASFFLEGKTKALSINIASGTGRFEGERFIADDVSVFHRGANKVIVHPVNKLSGEIRSTGDLIAVNRPDEVAVEVFFTGKLLFQ
ncbi:head GIN domain-containing protein [Aquimarina hainanensis]|uniref:Head GIN domain-containing protein n=1 Tax=Aquimarina hainanensis TaxID=1578017 RepID=A0ABW5N944_9FLAO